MKSLILALALAVSGPWTLSDCIRYALDHNIEVKQSSLTVEQKEIALNTARNRRLPNLAGSASQNFSFGRGLTADNTYENSNTTSTGFSLGTSIPVFQGFDIRNDIALSKLDLAAASADLDKARNDIRTSVAAAYAEILYDKEILQVAQRQVGLDSTLVDRIVAMKDAGKASEAEVAAQKATLSQSKLTQTQAANALQLAILDLSQILELESPEGFDIVSPSTDALRLKLLENPEDIYAQAIEIKPEIMSGKLRLDYAKTNIDRAKGDYLPSLSLSGGLGSDYYTSSNRTSSNFGTQLQNNFSQYVGLSLNVPIFSRMATRNKVRSAEVEFKKQELQLQGTKKALYKEIQQAYYNAVAAGTKLTGSDEAAQSASISYNLTREKYENGKANVTEYNESKARWLEATSNFLKARYEYLYLTSILEFYKGRELIF